MPTHQRLGRYAVGIGGVALELLATVFATGQGLQEVGFGHADVFLYCYGLCVQIYLSITSAGLQINCRNNGIDSNTRPRSLLIHRVDAIRELRFQLITSVWISEFNI